MAVPLKLKYVDLSIVLLLISLSTHLDTSQQTLCIAGSLDEVFGKRLAYTTGCTQKTKISCYRDGYAYLG